MLPDFFLSGIQQPEPSYRESNLIKKKRLPILMSISKRVEGISYQMIRIRL